jgi:hypothetical protein
MTSKHLRRVPKKQTPSQAFPDPEIEKPHVRVLRSSVVGLAMTVAASTVSVAIAPHAGAKVDADALVFDPNPFDDAQSIAMYSGDAEASSSSVSRSLSAQISAMDAARAVQTLASSEAEKNLLNAQLAATRSAPSPALSVTNLMVPRRVFLAR